MGDNVTEAILRLKDEVSARLTTIDAALQKTGDKAAKTFSGSAVNVRAFAQNLISVITTVKTLADRFGDAAEKVLNFSEQFGVSTDQTQQLEFAAKLAGTELEALTPIMMRLATAQGKAGLGNRDLFQSLQDVAREFAAMPAGAEKAAASAELFGRGGAKLISVLSTLEETSKRAPIVSETDLKRLDAAGDSITEMSVRLEKLTAATVLPGLEVTVNFLENKLIPLIKDAAQLWTRSFMSAKTLQDIDTWQLYQEGLAITAAKAKKAAEATKELTSAALGYNAAVMDFGPGVPAAGKTGGLVDDLLHGDERSAATAKRRQEIVQQLQQVLKDRRTAMNKAAQDEAQDRLEIEQKFNDAASRLNEERLQKQTALAQHLAELEALERERQMNMTFTGGMRGFHEGLQEVQNDLLDLRERGRQVAYDLANGLGSAFENLFFDVAENGFKDLSKAAKQFGADVLKMIAQIAVRQAALSAVSGVLGGFGVGGAPGVAAAEGGVLPGPIVGFRRLAAGGVVSSPTLALMGEGRRREAVVPLSGGRSIPVEMKGGAEKAPKSVAVSFHLASADPRGMRDLLVQEWPTLKNKIMEAMNTDQGFRQRLKSVR